MSKMIDMSNQTFGELTVIEQAPKNPNIKSRTIQWVCKCSCGNIKIVTGSNLRNGNTKSCGCLQKKVTSQLRRTDLTGQIFGKLTVIEKTDKKASNNHTIYKCQCECGNICEVIGDNLSRGLTKSCGCNWHNSYGVLKIKELLSEYNYPYEVEVKENIDNINYYWDFIVRPGMLDSWIIEFDGKQHFKSGSEKGWNTKENLKHTHRRDTIKNNFAFQNDIVLIRIPYIDENKITIEDLDPSTSKYVVNKYNIDNYYRSNGYEEEEYDGE